MKIKRISLVLLSAFILLLAACAPAASPTQTIPSAKSGDVLFQEDFSNNTSGWDRVLNDGGIMDYDSGGYRMLVQQPKMNFWFTPGKYFGDVRIEVDVTKLNGPNENRAGLICR